MQDLVAILRSKLVLLKTFNIYVLLIKHANFGVFLTIFVKRVSYGNCKKEKQTCCS